MAGVSRKISAASARAHTRKPKKPSSFPLPSGMFRKIALLLTVGFLAWAYQAIQPPPPKLCGSPNGPPITASRIKLKDGRHLAYKEHGVPRDEAKYKVVYVHGFDSCRHDSLPLSKDLAEDLKIYMVSFDRAGYGESDANPKRTVKSTVMDIEELADQLTLGSKFYIIGFSMGGQVVWSCLKYIPHRLAGATLISPVVNYWWRDLPANLSQRAFNKKHRADEWAVSVSHYTPWLTYWWNTQKWFPSSSVIAHSLDIFSPADKLILPRFDAREHYVKQITQQGEFFSLHLDMIIGFGNWEFSPTELENPFPSGEGSIHLWHGIEDGIVPVEPIRYIVSKLPWIRYHELPDAGHMFLLADGFGDNIVKSLVLNEK